MEEGRREMEGGRVGERWREGRREMEGEEIDDGREGRRGVVLKC